MTALREALAARSIKPERLIASGLSAGRVEELLNNADPTVDEVRSLSRHLHIPVRELLVSPLTADANLKFRSNFGRDVPEEAEYEGAVASHQVGVLGAILGDSSLPYFAGYPKTLPAAEELAVMFRENLLGFGRTEPVFGLSKLLFDVFGVVQLVSKFRSLDGVTTRSGGAAIVLIAPRHNGRMRFTLCHEVCHLLTDLSTGSSEVWLDQEVTRERRHSSNFKEESFANAFAAACLLPPKGVATALKNWRKRHSSPSDGLTAVEVMHVARSFGTSFDVAGSRLEVLDLLPVGATATLKSAILEDYASPEKFADHFGLTQDPGENWDAVARAALKGCADTIRDGELSVERAAELFGISLQDAVVIADVGRYH